MNQNPETPNLVHSKIGISAFVAGMIVLLSAIFYFVYFLIDINTKLWLSGNLISTPSLYFFGILPCGLILGLATLILGVWALFQKGYKKLLPGIAIALAVINFIAITLLLITAVLYAGG